MSSTTQPPVGSVLVLGSGIAGMQSALDLANAGYLVHMVTKQPSIGGKMTQLDKTFPTNECAMCLLGPKMTDTLSHPNIRLHTCSEIAAVEGEAGNFAVTIQEQPRYININECTACSDCEQACPVEVPNEFNMQMDRRKAVYKMFPQAVPNKYLIEKRGTPPCRSTCPAGTNAQGYTALISKGKFQEALEVVRRRMPFAGICGRICHHPCETACNRGQYDEPVAIATLKRAAYDFGWEGTAAEAPQPVTQRTEKVAIIGGGPGGLAAARDLALWGFQTTIYEALPKAGGMLRAGIPRYRLPETVVDKEVNYILGSGIELKANTRIGKDITLAQLRQDYQAVLIAVGIQNSRMLPLEGANLQGVVPGMEFLQEAALGGKPAVGQRVLVIGGGNVAIDVARTALRLGSPEVHLACLESREEMPAHQWEIEEAVDEGVVLHPSWGPERFLGENGQVSGLEAKRCTAVFDADGRFNPTYDTDTKTVLPADMVIVAIGQAADLGLIDEASGVKLSPRGTIELNPLTLATSAAGVFACGDIATGPGSVVGAVGNAHEAAESIRRYLDKDDLAAGRSAAKDELLGPPENQPVVVNRRLQQALADPQGRSKDFQEVYQGFTREMAIEEAQRCLNCGVCSECLQCQEVCKKNAVEHHQQQQLVQTQVGAIILAPGFDLFDARTTGEFGYGIYQNVMISMDFERLLSSTGPTQGHVVRPSDQQAPRKVAFIQCVGSRDCAREGSDYCSAICCMYSTKEAIIAREHDSQIEPTIFYLDMRSYGKNFDRYVEAAKAGGVRYIRTMISGIKEDPVTKNLQLQYYQDGKLIAEEYDLVVLAIGLKPPQGARQLAETVGIELNEYGYARTSAFNPTATTRPGVFVAGVFQGPRDIPETVMNASAAACTAGALLTGGRGQLVAPKQYPAERDVSQEEPRVGVFICRCGINIAAIVDVPGVVQHARQLPGVVHVEENLYTCSQDTLKRIQEIADEKQLNRVVVASCTIRTHQPLFRETLRGAGLNQFLFEMANIRDQCSWVHRQYPELATVKAKDLVQMAVAKVKTHQPLHLHPVAVVPRALVVGGGIAGMTAALNMASQGYQTYLVEREAQLGGNLRNLRYSLEGDDFQHLLRDTIQQVDASELIAVYTNSRIEDFAGHQGHFVTTISVGAPGKEHVRQMVQLEHGAVIVATGASERQVDQYTLGKDNRVVTNTQLEQALADGKLDTTSAKQVVFIQCVGSRTAEHMYCGRTCCAQSVKNALAIKRRNPATQVYILYRDMRTYGLMEAYYRESREAGIIFIPFADDKPPVLRSKEAGMLEIEVVDEGIGIPVVFWPDQLVLATGTAAPADIQRLASMFKVPVNEDGFLVETHAKLGPIDFPSAGLFMCGAGHSPKFVSEAIYQAQGAVARAVTVLSKDNLMVGGVVAQVDDSKCAACLTCVRVCPYSVPRINEQHVAEINAVQCQGCGTCASECPAKAIQLQHYQDGQVIAKVDGLFADVEVL